MGDSSDLFDLYRKSVHHETPKANETGEVEDMYFNNSFLDVIELHFADSDRKDVFRTTADFKEPPANKRKFGEYSLLLRRVKSQNTDRSWNQLEMQSSTLREAFRKIAAAFTTINLHNDPIVVREPYCELYHCRARIQEEIEKAPENLKAELMLLKSFEKDFMSSMISMVDELKKVRKISFEFLWTLFPPGELLVLQNREGSTSPVLSCVRLQQFQLVVRHGPQAWSITVDHFGFDGRKFGMVRNTYQFPVFAGFVNISALPAYPLQYSPAAETLQNDLIDRIRVYRDLCRGEVSKSKQIFGSHRLYHGPFWTPKHWGDDRGGCEFYDIPARQISGRIVVDPDGLANEMSLFRDTLVDEDKSKHNSNLSPQSTTEHSTSRSLNTIDDYVDGDFSKEELLTCPATIPAYDLGTKQWGFVLVDIVRNVVWQENILEGLQMEESKKNAIQNLVGGHTSISSDFDDVISGKGKGLVFLLHGPPGSGKTLTAESVAEHFCRPLYYISGGELGTEVGKVESRLQLIFSRVARWNAVLLFDEADTFMAERKEDSMDRNALVSVLLRLLEYQSGVLFLTTNRISDFDSAFHSRIHVSIEYTAASEKQRQFIWNNLLRKMNHTVLDSEVNLVAQLPLSGRTVKNILRLATLVASQRDSGKDLRFQDIKAVLPLAVGDRSKIEVPEEAKFLLE